MRALVSSLVVMLLTSVLAGCDPHANDDLSDLEIACGSSFGYQVSDPKVELRETSRGPDGATYELVRGRTRYLAVAQGASMAFPTVSGGVVREHADNPIAENFVGGRLKELRFKQESSCPGVSFIQVVILPESGPDRDMAEAFARSIWSGEKSRQTAP